MKAMQHFSGEAAHLIARGGTTLGCLLGGTSGANRSMAGPYEGAFAEVIRLPVDHPLLAVYFPAANELITLPIRSLVDLANAERLRLMAEDAKNGKSGPYPDD